LAGILTFHVIKFVMSNLLYNKVYHYCTKIFLDKNTR